MKVKTAIKTAGLSFAGYALASLFADKIPLNPMACQVAGFVGAFLGTLVTPRRDRREQQNGAAKQNGTSHAAAGAGAGRSAAAAVSVAAHRSSGQAEPPAS